MKSDHLHAPPWLGKAHHKTQEIAIHCFYRLDIWIITYIFIFNPSHKLPTEDCRGHLSTAAAARAVLRAVLTLSGSDRIDRSCSTSCLQPHPQGTWSLSFQQNFMPPSSKERFNNVGLVSFSLDFEHENVNRFNRSSFSMPLEAPPLAPFVPLLPHLCHSSSAARIRILRILRRGAVSS